LRNQGPHRIKFPFYGYLAAVIMLGSWYLNWSLEGLRTHWGFFPLWLGYCLLIDAITYYRKGKSLFSTSKLRYIGLFLVSAPCWWFFELLNQITEYWVYSGRAYFTDLEYFLFASLSFSTVIPAVFGTAELIGTLKWNQGIEQWRKISTRPSTKWIFFGSGVLMLFLALLFPTYGAAFIWISIFFILDPINLAVGQPSIIGDAMSGNWRRLIMLWCGILVCGFLWEMWNYYSFPKWYYAIPGVDYAHIFEMPLPGYLGYLPFSLELFAMYHFILYAFRLGHLKDYVKL